jgi:sec-independent protein translocase protein TatA
MDFGWPEILVVLVIVLLLFGPGRISKVAGEIGSGIRNFRKSLDGQDEKKEDSKKDGDEPKDSKDQGSS